MGFKGGIAHSAGRAADYGNHAVAGILKSAQNEKRQEGTQVKGIRRRIKPAVKRHLLALEECGEFGVGDLADEAAPFEIGVEIHPTKLPQGRKEMPERNREERKRDADAHHEVRDFGIEAELFGDDRGRDHRGHSGFEYRYLEREGGKSERVSVE